MVTGPDGKDKVTKTNELLYLFIKKTDKKIPLLIVILPFDSKFHFDQQK